MHQNTPFYIRQLIQFSGEGEKSLSQMPSPVALPIFHHLQRLTSRRLGVQFFLVLIWQPYRQVSSAHILCVLEKQHGEKACYTAQLAQSETDAP